VDGGRKVKKKSAVGSGHVARVCMGEELVKRERQKKKMGITLNEDDKFPRYGVVSC